jgi:tellurite resistance protein
VLVGVAIGWAILRAVFQGAKTPSEAPTAIAGGEALRTRLTRTQIGDDGPAAFEIEGRGLLPLQRPTEVVFVTSVFDVTEEDDYAPVVCAVDSLQEATSSVYQYSRPCGLLNPGAGAEEWIRLGSIIPEIIQPPYGGVRRLRAFVRMVDGQSPPPIQHGFIDAEHPGLLWAAAFDFTWTFNDKGYQEASEHRDESRSLGIRIAVAVAMSDGELQASEGKRLREWIKKVLEPLSESTQERLKPLFNAAMKEAYEEAKKGALSLSAATRRMNEIAEPYLKYETMELCYDIMAADGVADPSEMTLLRQLAEALELDLDQVTKMRDKTILSLQGGPSHGNAAHQLLGIHPDWSSDQIKKHLRTEFQKWNNRLNTLTDEQERATAQRMIDLIAEARKQHG